jgi:hypothetical protein
MKNFKVISCLSIMLASLVIAEEAPRIRRLPYNLSSLKRFLESNSEVKGYLSEPCDRIQKYQICAQNGNGNVSCVDVEELFGLIKQRMTQLDANFLKTLDDSPELDQEFTNKIEKEFHGRMRTYGSYAHDANYVPKIKNLQELTSLYPTDSAKYEELVRARYVLIQKEYATFFNKYCKNLFEQ